MAEATRLVYNAATGEMTEETFEFVGPTIEEVKAQKKQEINAAFENQINNGTEEGYLSPTYAVHFYDSQTDLNNYKIAKESMVAQGLSTRYVKVKEANPFYEISSDGLQIVINELVVFGDNLWVTKQDKYNAIDAATTIEEVQAITW